MLYLTIIISAIRRLNPAALSKFSAPISAGSWGGPVLNRRGEVAGMATSLVSERHNLNFAVPADAIRAVIASLDRKFAFPPASVVDAASQTSLAPLARALNHGSANAPYIDPGIAAMDGRSLESRAER